MSVDLQHRATELTERMDDPACDEATLRRTYRRFPIVNRLVAGWRRTYVRHLRPRLLAVRSDARRPRLLDIGSGGGDVSIAIARWAEHDGMLIDVTGVDPDPVAHAVATDAARRSRAPIRFLRARAGDIDDRFDIVISNHVLHHIADLPAFLDDSRERCSPGGLVVHSDIARSRFAYMGFGALALPLAPGTFIREDGLLSIRRSYTARELRAAAPDGWHVDTQTPSRLLLHAEVPHA